MVAAQPARINQAILISGELFATLPDVEGCELVEGRIVQMTPPGFEHGEVEATLTAAVVTFVQTHRLGRVSSGEAGIYTSREPDTVRGVDMLFIAHERYAKASKGAFLDVAPDLIVEILSPGNSASELMQKLREYFTIGVRLVWVVDPPARRIYAYRSPGAMREFTAADDLDGEDVLPGFTLAVGTLFSDRP